MDGPNQIRNLQYDIDAENLILTDAEQSQILADLDTLLDVIAEFPVAHLHINFQYYQNSDQTKCKLALVLPDRPLVTADVGEHWRPIFEHCVRKLIKRVKQYKAALENSPVPTVVANRIPDAEQIQSAVAEGNYEDFRVATYPYEADVRSRVGRWVQRYPEVDARIGIEIWIADIVEEVFLNAFSRFDRRPSNVRFGEWLEQLIDPSLKLIAEHPDEAIQEISFARTMREMNQ